MLRPPSRAGARLADRVLGGRRPRVNSAAGFTLLEVILAVSIAIGLLMVVLYFYRQAADLRTQLIQEAERISSFRLVMDRITDDLRTARNDVGAGFLLSGDSTSLRLVKTAAPSLAAWRGGQLGRAAFPETDLRQVGYSLVTTAEGTNLVSTGLNRTEEPAVELRRTADLATREPVAAPKEGKETPKAGQEAPEPASTEPLSDAIRYVHFRYWDGTKWAESWSGTDLPLGVEVTLASEPPPEPTEFGEEPWEVYRRVVCLPAGVRASSSTNSIPRTGSTESAGEVMP